MKQRYALKDSEKRARATGLSLPISTKHSVEVCNFIRNKKLDIAISQLRDVVAGKIAIPYKRYKRDLSHKKGLAAGRYPKKTCEEIIKLLESVKANAADKGLGQGLVIKYISASKASRPWRYGRHRRRKAKRTHIKVIVEEVEEKERKRKVKEKKREEEKEEERKVEKKEKEEVRKEKGGEKKEEEKKEEEVKKENKTKDDVNINNKNLIKNNNKK